MYVSDDKYSKSDFSVINTGLYDIELEIPYDSQYYKLEYDNGILLPNQETTISITINLSYETYPTINIMNSNKKYGACYSVLVLPVYKHNNECKRSDTIVSLGPCINSFMQVTFDFKEPKTCSGGNELLTQETLSCGIQFFFK